MTTGEEFVVKPKSDGMRIYKDQDKSVWSSMTFSAVVMRSIRYTDRGRTECNDLRGLSIVVNIDYAAVPVESTNDYYQQGNKNPYYIPKKGVICSVRGLMTAVDNGGDKSYQLHAKYSDTNAYPVSSSYQPAWSKCRLEARRGIEKRMTIQVESDADKCISGNAERSNDDFTELSCTLITKNMPKKVEESFLENIHEDLIFE